MVLSSLFSYFKSANASQHPIATQSQFLAKYIPLSEKPYAKINVGDKYSWEMFRVRLKASGVGAKASIVGALTTPFGGDSAKLSLSSVDGAFTSSNATISGSSTLTPHKTLTLFVFKLDGSMETSFRGVTQSDLSRTDIDEDTPTDSSMGTDGVLLQESNPDTLSNLRIFARSFIQRQKTIRHPSMLQYIDSFELEDKFYLVTEYCLPLDRALRKMQLSQHFDKCVEWGLFQTADALQFLHEKSMYHNWINMDSVFVVKSGDWKLAHMAFLTQERHKVNATLDGDNAPTSSGTSDGHVGSMSSSSAHSAPSEIPSTISEICNLFANRGTTYLVKDKYLSPEMSSQDSHAIEQQPNKLDSWGMAVLIYEIFIGRSQPLSQRGQLTKLPKSLSSKIPAPLFKAYKHLVTANMKQRWDMQKFIHSDYFSESEYVDTLLFLQELSLKEQEDIDAFLEELSDQLENSEEIPSKCIKYRILPALVSCVKYGSVSKSSIRALFLLGSLLDDEEYKHLFVPAMIELFSMDNPLIQLNLLQNIEQIVQSIESDQIVEQKIFRGALEKWFQSNVSKIREMSVKALIPVVPRLSDTCIDQIVVRILWALLGDSQGSIRTNTIIVTGKLAASMPENTREKILLPAVSKALKDPFKHSRLHALKVLNETQSLHTPANIATKIIPIISSRMMDPSAEIRQLTIDTIQSLVNSMKSLNDADQLVPKKTENEAEEKEDVSSRFSWALSSVKRVIGRTSNEENTVAPPSSTKESGIRSGDASSTKALAPRKEDNANAKTQYQPIFSDEVVPQQKSRRTKRPSRKWSNTFSEPSARDDEDDESSNNTASRRHPSRLTRGGNVKKSNPQKVDPVDENDPFSLGSGWEIDIPEIGSSSSKPSASTKPDSDEDVFGSGWEIDIPPIPVMKPTQKRGNARKTSTSDWTDDWE
mmetsp:Transcript_7602/g.28505  ORF Transcript_7602/g.28505 Transcript_7602/m.28505 type:complete len:930 (-) Transcript_7602:248-3037(-)|eukprot:CAMPEP_0117443162 /NCGR_PEP_ID=MMETSP0759-20121206/4549_1 /TAXON_ID=63605 /ORGANISM="Percolomonas cosmopolitus, Strain WS" /LENGTH=929 /DNA_ID=CAMNT_0005235121 /DNA_START=642 /DNA_END=3431 /DNA_ORIENTATION=-